ncbi:MAG: periplasmic heavy metal sensor [Deltaproteobacteria bacterium]|nr:periplasmic heavy metal sensor [Deltaproteobacteria bacterium]
MKRNFWICLLVFSLALNLGGLAAFGYLRLQGHREAMTGPGPPPPPPQEIWATLNLEAEQRRVLENLLPEHRRCVRDLRTELAQKRFELFETIKEGTAAWPAIQTKIKEVSVLQGKLEEEVLRFSLAFQEHLKPEQKAAFSAFVERRLPGAPGGQGRMGPKWKKDLGGGRQRLPGHAAP